MKPPVAQVCLYGTRETGFAYLASGPALSSPILAQGGWSAEDETRPSGRFRTLTEIIAQAKADLRALGTTRGELLVCFPGGERCARTRVETFESAGHMKLEAAPVVVVTADTIENAARRVGASTTTRANAPARASKGSIAPTPLLGMTTSGKPVPRVPERLGALEKAASAAVNAHGLFHPKATPAVLAAQSALRAHLEAYASGFTVEEHREAAKLIADYKWAHDVDRYLRYAHNGLENLHRRVVEVAEDEAREALWR